MAQIPGNLVEIQDERFEVPGRRYVVECRMHELSRDPNVPLVPQLIDRAAAITHIARNTMQELQTDNPNWTLSVVMEYQEHIEMLDAVLMNPLEFFAHVAVPRQPLNDHVRRAPGRAQSPFGVHRRFRTVQQVDEYLSAAIVRALENLAQSDRDLDLNDVVIILMFDLPLVREGRGRMPAHVRKTIASEDHTKGLAKYVSIDGLCAFQAIVYALALNPVLREKWQGDLAWFLDEFPNGQVDVKYLRKSKKRMLLLSERLKQDLQMEQWHVSAGYESSALALVRQQPALQVVVYNEPTRMLIEQRRGSLCERGEGVTILLSWTMNHIQLITGPFAYFGRSYHGIFCYECLQFKVADEPHICRNVVQCDCCFIRFESEEHEQTHKEGRRMKCAHCQRSFHGELCFGSHRCTQRDKQLCEHCGKVVYAGHACGEYTCITCNKKVQDGHRCYIEKPKEPEPMDAREVGKDYYAFDLESMLITLPMVDGKIRTQHEVNLIVVRRCFSDEEWVFHTCQEFVVWMESLTTPSVLFAHNLKGYDGRMIFDYLFERHTPPQEMMWRGAKIMKMIYGKVTFMDTLLHLPASLEQLPKMLGLDERQFKKGFFPYRFNTPDHQAYVGPIPDREYFDPEMMSTKKKRSFEEWYVEQRGLVYDFKKELLEYCQSDVRILAKAIEAYMSQQMSVKPLNPFSCTTIASYALTMYRTYYMPENSLCRLSSKEHDDIAKAMHGGRTDTRCLLREYSSEEVRAGIYAKYQDVQSLYPTVQFYDPLPVGAPKLMIWETQPSLEQVKQVFGFVCCDIEPTRYLHHPVLVEVDPTSKRLVADLKPKQKVVIPTPELQLALENGYKITRVYWWYEFESSTDLFKPYFRDVLKDKIEAAGKPKWTNTPEKWNEFVAYHRDELGIELCEQRMIPNASKKAGAKLLANSLWGKFGERNKYNRWESFGTDQEKERVLGLEHLWMDGAIDIHFRKYTGDQSHVGIVYSYNKSLNSSHYLERKRRGHTNIAVAAMVTSHARCRLWQELNKLGDRVLYHDTDSIIYENRPDMYSIPTGRYLGEWECETGGRPIIGFVSTGPKCYSYIIQNEDGTTETHTKVKGITLNHTNSQRINFDSMKMLVRDEERKVLTDCLMFKYDRVKGTMITETTLKEFKKTYEKGYIDERTWKVYPFGYEKFITLA